MNRLLLFFALAISCLQTVSLFAADPKESDFYRITTFETPLDSVLESGVFNQMSDGRLAVATRRSEIWMIENPFSENVESKQFKRFAHGLHEPLGLAERDGWLYVTQRSDVSRLRDKDGDGIADEFEIMGDGWEICGDYHEYAFGSKFDKDGNIWVATCLTGSFGSNVPYRGWCLRVTPDGKTVPTTYGLRSPGGIAFNSNGDTFYTDNQGPWNGAPVVLSTWFLENSLDTQAETNGSRMQSPFAVFLRSSPKTIAESWWRQANIPIWSQRLSCFLMARWGSRQAV